MGSSLPRQPSLVRNFQASAPTSAFLGIFNSGSWAFWSEPAVCGLAFAVDLVVLAEAGGVRPVAPVNGRPLDDIFCACLRGCDFGFFYLTDFVLFLFRRVGRGVCAVVCPFYSVVMYSSMPLPLSRCEVA